MVSGLSLPESLEALLQHPADFVTHSKEETERLGESLAKVRDLRILALGGGFGSGKTTLVRGLARGLGVTDKVRSPSYIICHEYAGPRPLWHMDFCRLGASSDLSVLEWPPDLDRAVVAVEWADRFARFMPRGSLWVHMELVSETSRSIHIGVRGKS